MSWLRLPRRLAEACLPFACYYWSPFWKEKAEVEEEVLQEECVSLCTHIIDSQRWQTNYSFRLNASLLCILFANSPLFPSCVLEKHKTKWVHRLCFWWSPALCLSPLFFFFFWLRKTESLLLEKKKKLLLNFNAYAYFDYFLKLIILIRG